MDCTIYCCKKGDNKYNLIYSNQTDKNVYENTHNMVNIINSKESKETWYCSGYCDEKNTSKEENMYQISTKDVFRRVCDRCLDTSVFEYIFGENIECIKKQISKEKEYQKNSNKYYQLK